MLIKRRPVIALACGAVAAALIAAVPVTAARNSTRAEAKVVRAAVSLYMKGWARTEPPKTTFKIGRIRVSTVNPHYATAGVSVLIGGSSPDSASALVRRMGSRCRVLTLGTAFECSLAPPGVLKDLGGCF